MSENCINVIVADDNRFFAEAVASAINNFSKFNSVGSFTDLDELVDAIGKTNVNLLVLDVNFNGNSSLDYIDKLKAEKTDLCIVSLTTMNNSYMKKQALETGVDGFLGKDECFDDLEAKLLDIYNHLTKQSKNSKKKHDFNDESFTEHQLNIIRALYNHNSEKEVAESLFISTSTLKTHKQKLFLKTETQNNLELIKFGIRQGIIIV